MLSPSNLKILKPTGRHRWLFCQLLSLRPRPTFRSCLSISSALTKNHSLLILYLRTKICLSRLMKFQGNRPCLQCRQLRSMIKAAGLTIYPCWNSFWVSMRCFSTLLTQVLSSVVCVWVSLETTGSSDASNASNASSTASSAAVRPLA